MCELKLRRAETTASIAYWSSECAPFAIWLSVFHADGEIEKASGDEDERRHSREF